jgi:ankyrin repeat protein
LAASEGGHIGCVKALVNAGADVYLSRYDGIHPLFMASFEGHLSVAAFLAERAEPNQANDNGATSLFIAAQEGHSEGTRIRYS